MPTRRIRGSRPSWAFAFSLIALAVAGAAGAPARAETVSAYELLEKKAKAVETEDHLNGWAYVVSGTVALGVSIPAYYLSDDLFARAVYSVGETLGVASVGYGTYLLLVDTEYSRFYNVLRSEVDLRPDQRDRLAREFLIENARRARNARKIRVITHALTATLNFVDGATSSFPELQEALFFLGGINALAAVGFAFSSSEEEKLAGLVASAGPLPGGGAQLRLAIEF